MARFKKLLSASESGLVCTYIGDRKDLELQTILNILVRAQPVKELYSYSALD